MIACGHCGDRHATVAEVRACATEAPARSNAPGEPDSWASESPWLDPEPRVPTRPPTDSIRPSPVAGVDDAPTLPPEWDRLAGPRDLGRPVVVAAGQAAPGPWAASARIVVAGSHDDALDRLQRARVEREPVVIELTAELPAADPVLSTEWWRLRPDLDLEGERLRHLVLANSIDARDPDRPRFDPVTRAVAAGATAGGPADVVLADGTSAWVDGGPLDWFDEATLNGHVLVPAVHIDTGRLGPLRTLPPTADLAPDQLEAVTHSGGAARIIAPAGSGKTRVLTERARHLIVDRGIHPATICLVAFNVRARAEMQERTTDLPGLEIRTLNSLALAIVQGTGPFRMSAGGRRRDVIEERQVRGILSDLVSLPRRAMSDPLAAWIEALGTTRLGLRDPIQVESDFGGDVKDFPRVAAAYRDRLRERGWLDFDEQIIAAIEILLGDPAARATARRACRLLLVDEFQDLTPAHVLLLRLLAGPAGHVFAVGDDDQTIYGYAGASPAWLIGFGELFGSSATHDLHVNYRCPADVVAAANTLLGYNRQRVPKQTVPVPGATTEGLTVRSADEPSTVLVEHVRSLVDDGVAPCDIAVLTRVNATLLAPMVALADAGVPATRPIGPAFRERTGVAGALSWLDLAVAPERQLPEVALEQAARRPPRALSRRLVGWMAEQRSTKDLRALARRLREERDSTKVEAFADDVDAIRGQAAEGSSTAELLLTVRDGLGLGGALEGRLDASRRSVDRSSHSDDLAALIAVARFEPDPSRFGSWLAAQLRPASAHDDGVRLATVHRVKGREWPHVVLYEATAGLFPHRLATDGEEERRVFHVGLTRCSDSVLVLAGRPVSPFVAELTEPAPPEPVHPPSAAPEQMRSARRRTTTPKAPAVHMAPVGDSIEIAARRERLKTWRSERSRADGVPAYVVFNDETLYQLAEFAPGDNDALLAIKGIGPAKVERYGPVLLELLSGT